MFTSLSVLSIGSLNAQHFCSEAKRNAIESGHESTYRGRLLPIVVGIGHFRSHWIAINIKANCIVFEKILFIDVTENSQKHERTLAFQRLSNHCQKRPTWVYRIQTVYREFLIQRSKCNLNSVNFRLFKLFSYEMANQKFPQQMRFFGWSQYHRPKNSKKKNELAKHTLTQTLLWI